ncbi:MAG: hypothetical protein AB7O81_27120 [Blastocatellales bacterium]
MMWSGVFVPIETHRGTQPVDVVVKKAEYYATLPNCRPLWTVSDYQPNPFEAVEKTAKDVGREIIEALQEANIVAQPLITPLDLFVANPLAKVLVSPRSYAISLNEIVSEPTSE